MIIGKARPRNDAKDRIEEFYWQNDSIGNRIVL